MLHRAEKMNPRRPMSSNKAYYVVCNKDKGLKYEAIRTSRRSEELFRQIIEGWMKTERKSITMIHSFVVTDVDSSWCHQKIWLITKCEPETQGYGVLDRTERKNRPKRETERPIIERLGQRSWRPQWQGKREITLPLEDSFQGTRPPLMLANGQTSEVPEITGSRSHVAISKFFNDFRASLKVFCSSLGHLPTPSPTILKFFNDFGIPSWHHNPVRGSTWYHIKDIYWV